MQEKIKVEHKYQGQRFRKYLLKTPSINKSEVSEATMEQSLRYKFICTGLVKAWIICALQIRTCRRVVVLLVELCAVIKHTFKEVDDCAGQSRVMGGSLTLNQQWELFLYEQIETCEVLHRHFFSVRSRSPSRLFLLRIPVSCQICAVLKNNKQNSL